MLDSVRGVVNVPQSSDSVGQGAQVFYAEMNSQVLPSLMRLTHMLIDAQRVTQQLRHEIKAAKDASVAVLHADGIERHSRQEATKVLDLPGHGVNFALQIAKAMSVPTPSGSPPIPVPGSPGTEWKWNLNPQNSRGGTLGPKQSVRGWDPDSLWDVDDGLGNRQYYVENG